VVVKNLRPAQRAPLALALQVGLVLLMFALGSLKHQTECRSLPSGAAPESTPGWVVLADIPLALGVLGCAVMVVWWAASTRLRKRRNGDGPRSNAPLLLALFSVCLIPAAGLLGVIALINSVLACPIL
jgi:hypothetical protein